MVAFNFRLHVWNLQKASWLVDFSKNFKRTVRAQVWRIQSLVPFLLPNSMPH
jgi:hypothetical protein